MVRGCHLSCGWLGWLSSRPHPLPCGGGAVAVSPEQAAAAQAQERAAEEAARLDFLDRRCTDQPSELEMMKSASLMNDMKMALGEVNTAAELVSWIRAEQEE